MRIVLTLLLSASLAACGNLPRPFQPVEKSTKTWSSPGTGRWGSILVQPISGLPEAQSTVLAEMIVEALHAREIPASRRSAGRGTVALAGQIGVASGSLHWTLSAPGGKTVHRFNEPRRARLWSEVTASDLAAVAARAAERIAAVLEPATSALAAPDASKLASVVLEAVHGAPGDGGIALAHAMRRALAHLGIAVADVPSTAALVILGRVSVAPSEVAADNAKVGIAWEVTRPDGTTIGTVRQSNDIAAARLAGAWGSLARGVATAGAPAVAALVRRAAPHGSAQTVRRTARPETPIETSVTTEAPIAVSVTVRW